MDENEERWVEDKEEDQWVVNGIGGRGQSS